MTMAKTKPEPTEKPNKTRMVEAALDELGKGASPKDLQTHIKSNYGHEISTTMISSYKSNILKKQGGGGGRGTASLGGKTIGVKDLTILRDLIDRVGVSELQSLIKILSR
jgi:hypothetical protein